MDRLKERLEVAQRALLTLQEAVTLPHPDAFQRDAALQRFEYTFEATWKAAQLFLSEIEGKAAGSPKSVIRSSREVGLLDDAQTIAALAMADDRNLTVHTYIETLAQQIHGRLSGHLSLLTVWLGAMAARASG